MIQYGQLTDLFEGSNLVEHAVEYLEGSLTASSQKNAAFQVLLDGRLWVEVAVPQQQGHFDRSPSLGLRHDAQEVRERNHLPELHTRMNLWSQPALYVDSIAPDKVSMEGGSFSSPAPSPSFLPSTTLQRLVTLKCARSQSTTGDTKCMPDIQKTRSAVLTLSATTV